MTKARSEGLSLVFLGAAIFLLVGFALENGAPVTAADFRVLYFSARCLVEHRDPYQERAMQQVYPTEGEESSYASPQIRRIETRSNYLPSAFYLAVPFGILPFGPAHLIWLALTAASFIVASFLIWDIARICEPAIAGALVCLALATSELLLIVGNPAGIAISTCVIGVWCFIRGRYVPVGVLCLAISLMFKPHDTGFVWLYFLLVGGVSRKRALQTLFATVVISLPAVVWVTSVAPNWMHELQSILTNYAVHGDANDPGPASKASHGIAMVVSLQSVFSLFRDDPNFYNPLTYLIGGGLICIWLLKTMRTRFSPTIAWFALAPIAALSMVPVYHRVYDARLLILTIPACVMLWKDGGRLAWVGLLLTSAGFFLTGAVPWAVFLRLIGHLRTSTAFGGEILLAAKVVPVPLILLAIGIFYLWVYLRRAPREEPISHEG